MKIKRDKMVRTVDVFRPPWIKTNNMDGNDIASIQYGGCESGAYMPAVTYWQARQTMNRYGDDVLDYIEENLGELPSPKKGESWSGMACFYLSCAVELWASQFEVIE